MSRNIGIALGVALTVKHQEVSAKLIRLGIDPPGGSPEESTAQIKADKQRNARAMGALLARG